MEEKTYTLKEIKAMQSPLNRRNKRIEIEKRNLEASLLIKAHNKIMESAKKKEIDDLRVSVRGQVEAGIIPVDAYLEIFNNKIEVLSSRVEALKNKKDANNGFLSAGSENQLKMYEGELAKILEEKDVFLKDKQIELEQIKKAKEEFLRQEEEKKKMAQVRRDAALRIEEEAKIGRETLLQQARESLVDKQIEKQVEILSKGTPVK